MKKQLEDEITALRQQMVQYQQQAHPMSDTSQSVMALR